MAIRMREKRPGVWQVVDTRTDEVLYDDASYEVASNVQTSIALDRFIPGEECSEVAVAIVTAMRRRVASHEKVVAALEHLTVMYAALHNLWHDSSDKAVDIPALDEARAALKLAREGS